MYQYSSTVQLRSFTCFYVPLLLSKLTAFGKQRESTLIVKLQSSPSDVFCPSRLCPLHSFPYFLSHSFTSPLFSSTPSNSPHPLCPVTLYLSLFFLSLSLYSLRFLSRSLCYPCLLIQLGARAPLHCHYTLICFLCFLAVGVILQSGVEAIIN